MKMKNATSSIIPVVIDIIYYFKQEKNNSQLQIEAKMAGDVYAVGADETVFESRKTLEMQTRRK